MGKQILKFCLCSNGLWQRDMEGFLRSTKAVNSGSNDKITLFFSTTPRQPVLVFPSPLISITLQEVTSAEETKTETVASGSWRTISTVWTNNHINYLKINNWLSTCGQPSTPGDEITYSGARPGTCWQPGRCCSIADAPHVGNKNKNSAKKSKQPKFLDMYKLLHFCRMWQWFY